MKYVAFADESYITAQRFRSIALFSFSESKYDAINNELVNILHSSGIEEFKWKKLRDAKYRFCAGKIINYVIKHSYDYNIRLDVLVWDTHDRRHDVANRDDIANFERMFFHLLNSSMKRRPTKSKWKIYLDERLGIDWETIRQCLSAVGLRRKFIKSSLLGDFFSAPTRKGLQNVAQSFPYRLSNPIDVRLH